MLPDTLRLPLTTSTVDQLSMVDPAAWHNLSHGHGLYLGLPWSRAMEESPAFSPTYILVHDGSRLHGILPTYVTDRPDNEAYDPFAVFGGLRARSPLLLAGTRGGYANSLLINPVLDSPSRTLILNRLVNRAAALRYDGRTPTVAFLYLTTSAASDLACAIPADVPLLFTAADTYLPVEWDSWNDYLAWLPKTRRASVRKELSRFQSSGLRVDTGKLSNWYAQLAVLLANLERRYGIPANERWLTRYLELQAMHLDDAATVFLCFKGDRQLVGFSLFYRWENVFYARVAGFDYANIEQAYAYFNLMTYFPLRHAIDEGIRELRLGTGAYDAKLRRGARLDPLWSVVLPGDSVDEHWYAAALTASRDRAHQLREVADEVALFGPPESLDRFLHTHLPPPTGENQRALGHPSEGMDGC